MSHSSKPFIAVLFIVISLAVTARATTPQQTYGKGYRLEEAGWIYIHCEGSPAERGEQYGYLTADKYKEAMRLYKYMTYQTMGMDYAFFVRQATKLHKSKIPAELLEEMQGMAAGLTKAGVQASLDDIIGYNAFMELTESWWPSYGAAEFSKNGPTGLPRGKGRCSAFIATGDATADGRIVMTHQTFDDYWNAANENLIIDMTPTEGARMIYQAGGACFISSETDWFMNSDGIIGLETSIVGIDSYNLDGIPGYVRCRMAMQYGNTIDRCIEIMQKGNNGGNPATWLIGDVNTSEIAQFQQGLIYQATDKKTNGYFFGCNAVTDPRIRNLECTGVGYNDVRRQTGGRRTRFPQLLQEYYGKIDATIAKVIAADTYDVYLKKETDGGANTICAHYDLDPRLHFSDHTTGVWPDPFTPAGSIDCKITTGSMAADMQMLGRWGAADGRAFDADRFLSEHPQWNWQKGYLTSRPSQPWAAFPPATQEE